MFSKRPPASYAHRLGVPPSPPCSNANHSRLPAISALILCALTSLSCRCDSQGEATTAETTGSEAPPTTQQPELARQATSPSDFSLVLTPQGAQVLWLEAAADGTFLDLLPLDRHGAAVTEPQRAVKVAEAGVTASDLQAAWASDQLTVAWLAAESGDGGSGASAKAWVSKQPKRILELGAAFATNEAARNNLAIAPRNDAALVLVRGPEEACSKSTTCSEFTFKTIQATGVAEAAGVPLSVPVPCQDTSARILSMGRRFHYAVCTERSGQLVTTVFSITPSPEYAEARDLLPGCQPLGLSYWNNKVWLLGDCPQGRHAVRLGGDGGTASLSIGAGRLVCEEDRPNVQAAPLRIALAEPREGLELLLSTRGEYQLAAWTGQALLTLRRDGAGLSLEVSHCEGGRVETRRRSVFSRHR